MSDSITYHSDIIKCPKCNLKQVAKVLHTQPWFTWIHHCECDYIITESEWDALAENITEVEE